MLQALKYNLQMFGTDIVENETKIFNDNNSVIFNSSDPESTIKNKYHLINFIYVQEAVASGMALIYNVDTGSNLADLFTKVLDKVNSKENIQRIIY